jgi:hypothetical protein
MSLGIAHAVFTDAAGHVGGRVVDDSAGHSRAPEARVIIIG